MNKIILFFAIQTLVFSSVAQSDKELAYTKATEAIKIMDEGKLDESIKLLEESQKLDPENYMYPYEIAYAYIKKTEYKKAIKVLNKVKEYKVFNNQVHQTLGNCYDYLGKPDEAIREYEEGMERFPNSGNLHLEKGNIYLSQKKYDEAIKNYEKGIEVDPMYPSNYFRLAKLFLTSTDKLSGIIYGEIFMNLERTTARTQEMSKLLYDAYTTSITLSKDGGKTDFCDIVMDANDLLSGEDIKLPFCAIFGKNFILATLGEDKVDLNSISSMRKKFLESFFADDYKKYPNVLFQYQKELLDHKLFDTYSRYLIQMGSPDEFNKWVKKNNEQYEEFTTWYTQNKNIINITSETRYIR